MFFRFFVRKKEGFRTEERNLLSELNRVLDLDIDYIALYNLYDVYDADLNDKTYLENNILSEIVTDDVFFDLNIEGKKFLCYELLSSQYDQRGEAASQSLMILNNKEKLLIRSSKLIIFNDDFLHIDKVKNYLINTIDSQEKDLTKYDFSITLENDKIIDKGIDGFNDFDINNIVKFVNRNNIGLNVDDLLHIQNYFKNEEKRQPTMTEVKLLDTYWSDHCRHTTFETNLCIIDFNDTSLSEKVRATYENYLKIRCDLNRSTKPITLMDIATIGARKLKKDGFLEDVEESEEVNSASIIVDVDVNGEDKKYLFMFKNETHNHPTEIEPFGGASTCIGGAIRDPLSGRSYVYSGMRITGSGDITESIESTIKGKLPQSVISKQAALGFSSYGNQIGLATPYVKEIYHNGYKAKRLEVGVVVGSAPLENVKRKIPKNGDIIILIGGRTGIDGIGGATGSSKKHDENSLNIGYSEVQKGDAIVERKIQRLFRNEEAAKMIKKSNDFGAGGLSVAIGEIADGVFVDLNCVPLKYQGLTGTQIALSESQERMAAVIEKSDYKRFKELCDIENVEAVKVGEVTDGNRLVLRYNGIDIVNISRRFINTSGVRRNQDVFVNETFRLRHQDFHQNSKVTKEQVYNCVKDLNSASQAGMIEMFDKTIGRGTVICQFGGKYQKTETDGAIQKIFVDGYTDTVTAFTYGFNPYVSEKSPYLGSMYAVGDSLAKLVSMGVNYKKARLSFQEYFQKLEQDSEKWGTVFSALLGALDAQLNFKVPSISGKDSMSGTFGKMSVPPTLISFAFATDKHQNVISPEFKGKNNYIYLVKSAFKEDLVLNYETIMDGFDFILSNIKSKKIVSASTVKYNGICQSLFNMAFGNKICFDINTDEEIFHYMTSSIIIESTEQLHNKNVVFLGKTVDSDICRINGLDFYLDDILHKSESVFKDIYKLIANGDNSAIKKRDFISSYLLKSKCKIDKPKVLIPVFPGTNCEYDGKKAFEFAGADVEIFVFQNINVSFINDSISKLCDIIERSNILFIAGGFSMADEPDGSGKFISNILQSDKVNGAILNLIKNNDGLVLGICNGFQALVKSGFLPYGEVLNISSNSPTLFKNDINRHVSKMALTRVTSNKSPWFSSFEVGDVHNISFSHGEGKFCINEALADELFENGQIATQYCDFQGNPTMNGEFNINGSSFAIEGLTSKCGRIFGKMGHSERYENGLFKNIYGNKNQDIFKNGVDYFK